MEDGQVQFLARSYCSERGRHGPKPPWHTVKLGPRRGENLPWETCFLALRTGSRISAWTYLGKTVPILSSVYNESLVIACLFQKWAAIKFHSHKKDISRTRYNQLQDSVFTEKTKDLLYRRKKVKHRSISSLTSTKYLIFVLMVCWGRKVKWKTPFIFTLVSIMLYQKRR